MASILFFLVSTPGTANLFNHRKQKQKNLQVNTTFSQSKIFNKTPIKFQNEGKTTGFLILQTVFFFFNKTIMNSKNKRNSIH